MLIKQPKCLDTFLNDIIMNKKKCLSGDLFVNNCNSENEGGRGN